MSHIFSPWRGCRWLAMAAVLSGCVATTTTHEDRSGASGPKPVVTHPAAPAIEEKMPETVGPAPQPVAPSGSYTDRLEYALRERVGNSAVQVRRSGDLVKVVLPGNSVFLLNSEQIQPRFGAVLDGVAQVVSEYARTAVNIKGFTDATGSFEHNQQLSERRAQSVAAYLTQRQVAGGRVHATGYGPRYPLASNDSETGRSQNRRVEIDLTLQP